MLPSHQKEVLSEGEAARLLRSIGLKVISDYSPGFQHEVCAVDDGDVDTPVASLSDTASICSDYGCWSSD